MQPYYCCSRATTTAYERYGKTITRVKHERLSDTIYATGTTISPDYSVVPAATSKRYFKLTPSNTVQKHYLCSKCIELRSPLLEWHYVKKSEAYAALVTRALTQ